MMIPFYHATYANRLPAIMEQGLRPNAPKNWSFSREAVYLSECPYIAFDFADTCDECTQEDYNSGVVVLELIGIPDSDYLSMDNNLPEDSECYEYHDSIPPWYISKVMRELV